jgi:predicted transcriptional regulator
MKPEEIISKRKALGASQQDLSYHSGIKQPNIAAMERGKRVISAKTVERLEKAFTALEAENKQMIDWCNRQDDSWMDAPHLVAIRRSMGFSE